MADKVVKTKELNDIGAMADAVLFTMEYARNNYHKFTFGPLHREQLLSQGLHLTGDVDDLVAQLTKNISGVTVEDE